MTLFPWILFLLPSLINLASSSDIAHLHIAGFFPTSVNVSEGAVGRGVLPAVKLAMFHINNDKRILKDYKLHITWNNTQCSAADGMKAFFDMMHNTPLKYMLFGDACTSVTDPIAKASKHWKIVQLSYADMHPMFSKKGFPNLYRIVPSENEFNEPRVELLRKFNWTRVGTLYQNKPRYSLAHNRLVADLETLGVEVVAAQSFSDDISYQMKGLVEKDVRIILGNFNETWARRIFCEAYHQRLYGAKYQWLIVAAYTTHWWRKRDVNCTVEEVETALKGAILMDLNPLSTSQEITVSGMTASQYEELYKIVNLGEYSRFHGYAYDGIWAIALALHNISKHFDGGGGNYPQKHQLKAFKYHDEGWERAFLSALEATYFIGVTGPVRFRDNGRKGTVLIKQFQAFNTVNAEVKVGEFDGVTQNMNLAKGEDIVWNGRNPPKDRTIQIISHTRVSLSLYFVMALLSVFGILLACFFLIVNIKFRNQRYIKMSSPYLNNLIIIGCIFTYLSVILLGLDSKLTSIDAFPYICTARAWVLMAGFSLAFGSMFSKTWRVHSIFTNVKLNKKVIKDMQLFLVVGVLLSVDFAIMTSWHFIDPMWRATKELEPTVNEDIKTIPLMEYCESNFMSYFVGIIYAYKGLLMMFGCFLAWETRHVSIPALNDSKYIGMSVYNCVMMCVLGAPLSHVLSDQQDYGYFIISLFIIFCTTATLCLVFIPKIIELKRNPKGTVEKRVMRATLKPPLLSTGGTGAAGGAGGGASSSMSSHNQSYTNAGGGGAAGGTGTGAPSSSHHHHQGTTHSHHSSSNRRGSGTSVYETELKAAKQHNLKIRKQIRDVDNEIQAIAKLLGKNDADVKRILDENEAAPKSEVLKKEDTDVSSLYSLNSEGGGDVFDYEDEDEEEEEEEEEPKKKYPGIVEGLAGLAGPHWSSTLTKTLMVNTTTTTEVVNEKLTQQQSIPEQLEVLNDAADAAASVAVVPIATRQLPMTKQGSCSEYDLTSALYSPTETLKRSSSYEKLSCSRVGRGNKRRPVRTTRDEIWALILEKEKSRYLEERNSFFESEGKVLRKEQFMAIQGEEIFINGSNHTPTKHHGGGGISRRMSEASPIHHQPVDLPCSVTVGAPGSTPLHTNGKSVSLGRIIEEDHHHHIHQRSPLLQPTQQQQLQEPPVQKLTSRSFSVPRRLDNSSLTLSGTSSEINLDVSLLPIFHKILATEQQRRSFHKKQSRKKFIVSCPNILIKCDIVEYL